MIANNVGFVLGVNIHPRNWTLAANPETPGIHRGVKNLFRFLVRIKAEHSLKKFGIGAVPN